MATNLPCHTIGIGVQTFAELLHVERIGSAWLHLQENQGIRRSSWVPRKISKSSELSVFLSKSWSQFRKSWMAHLRDGASFLGICFLPTRLGSVFWKGLKGAQVSSKSINLPLGGIIEESTLAFHAMQEAPSLRPICHLKLPL